MTSVSIVVPTCGRPATLRETLRALGALDYSPSELEVIVVDDGPDRETAALVNTMRDQDARIKLLQQAGLGAAAARNAGARVAEGEVLLFCDDDMIVEPHHLASHLATHDRYGDVLVGSDRWYSPESLQEMEATPFGRFRVELERQFAARRHDAPLEGNCFVAATLASCDLSVRSRVFWGLNGFDDSFPYAGAEDQDLSTRAVRAGYRLIRNYDIRPLHNDPTTTLRQFCLREERGTHTVLALARKFPEYLGDFVNNGPLTRKDPLPLAVKKLVKFALSREVPLAAVHASVDRLERLALPDPVLWRVYRATIALHMFKGYRDALRSV